MRQNLIDRKAGYTRVVEPSHDLALGHSGIGTKWPLIFWLGVLASPLLWIGIYWRLDQLAILFVAAVFLAFRHRVAVPRVATAVFGFAVFVIVAAAVRSVVWGAYDNYFIINWPTKLAVFALIGVVLVQQTAPSKRHQLYSYSVWVLRRGLVCLAVLAVLQVAEFHGFLPNVGINRLISGFYPYTGEIESSELVKTGGLLLKMGGAGRATATFDGHPIHLGVFLAFALTLILPLVRNMKGMMLYGLPVVALLLTLTRGALLMWLVGLACYAVMYIAGEQKYMTAGRLLKVLKRTFGGILIAGPILYGVVAFTPLGDSVVRRVETTVGTVQGSGPVEGRTARVWPEAIEALSAYGTAGWIAGIPEGYDEATDSQYLWLLVNLGVLGVSAFLLFHLYLVYAGWRYYRLMRRVQPRNALLGISFSAAVLALIADYMVHPAFQGDRLASAVIVLGIFITVAPARRHARK